jgi:hypothetical protein
MLLFSQSLLKGIASLFRLEFILIITNFTPNFLRSIKQKLLKKILLISAVLFLQQLSPYAFAYPKKTAAAPWGSHGIVRGPYLQLGTTTSMIIRWTTDKKTDAKVQYGLSADKMDLTVSQEEQQNEHQIQLSNLSPNTRYFYTVGAIKEELKNTSVNFFFTAPDKDAGKRIRIWVTGDCGSGAPNQIKVRDAYIKHIADKYTNLWLLLGDNAYEEGYQDEYQANFFNVYKGHTLKETALWPVLGNHDYANNKERRVDHKIAYYDIFTLPTKGEAGGVPSNTASYYSFNYGNIHFIALDSYGKEPTDQHLYDTLSPQVVWLKKDLAANQQQWTIAFWHHPPYSKASHFSDKDQEMKSIRKNLLPILDRYKVDLVLCGHSHGYERSRPMKGYYGKEVDFDPALYNKSRSSGRYDSTHNSCPYNMQGDSAGTVYVVSGSAGRLEGSIEGFPHKAMYYSNVTEGGSMALEIKNNRLDALWIASDGVVMDQFTLVKNVNKTSKLSIAPGQKCTLTASWEGTYKWNNESAVLKTLEVAPVATTTYVVQDKQGCLKDTFIVEVNK